MRGDIVLHDPAFAALLHTDTARRALQDGAEILCNIVLHLQKHPEDLKQMQEELRTYRHLSV